MSGANETYEIDIEAALPDGDSTSAKLDSLTKSILGVEKGAGYLDAAFEQVSTALAAAKAATLDADAALAAGNAQWAELEGNANRAAKAVEKASARGAVPDDVAAQAASASAALNSYGVELAQLERASANARTSEQALALFLTQTGTAAKEASAAEEAHAKAVADAAKSQEAAAKGPVDAARAQARGWRQLGRALGTLPGPLGKLGSAYAHEEQGEALLTASLGDANATAIKAAAVFGVLGVAVAALTVAFIVGVVKVAAWAIGLADANRTAELATEAFDAMNPALANLPFDALTKQTGQSTATLEGLAKSLQTAGVSSDRLGDSLQTAALASTALGPEAASQYVQLEQAATDAQKVVDAAAKSGGRASSAQLKALAKARAAAAAFANTAKTKLGGIVKQQMLGLDKQADTFHRNIGGLFGDLNIDPALEGLQKLIALFDKDTAAGKALQFLFNSFFQPLVDAAKPAATAIEAFYLGVLIGAMKLYIALKPTIKAVDEFFGLDSGPLEVNFQTITKLGEELAPVFAAIAAVIGGVLLAAFVSVGAVIAAQVAVWYGIVKAVQFAIGVFGGIVDAVKSVYSYLTGIDLSSVGTQLMMGFVNGITSSLKAVVDAVTNVVSGAIDAAKSVLGIHSPSKVFAEIGVNTGEGYTGGVEDATDAAQGAMAQMVSPDDAAKQAAVSGDAAAQRMQGLDAAAQPAAAGAPAAADAGGSGGAERPTVHIDNLTINASDKAGGVEAADSFYERLTQLLEGDAAQAAGAAA